MHFCAVNSNFCAWGCWEAGAAGQVPLGRRQHTWSVPRPLHSPFLRGLREIVFFLFIFTVLPVLLWILCRF